MACGDFKDLTRMKSLLKKYCVITYLILLKIRNMMDIKGVLLQWFIIFLIKKILSNKELEEELHKPSLENLRNNEYNHLL